MIVGEHAFRILLALANRTANTCGHVQPDDMQPINADVAVNYVSCSELDCIKAGRVPPLADRMCDFCGGPSPVGWITATVGRIVLMLVTCDACELDEMTSVPPADSP
jgi:hypothetical protein